MAERTDHFKSRLAHHIDELRDLYLGIYHDEGAFQYFLDMLRDAYRARKASLRRRDLHEIARAGGRLSQKRIGMMLYTENFAGDLNGVREKIPYLKECDVNYLHLMPLLD